MQLQQNENQSFIDVCLPFSVVNWAQTMLENKKIAKSI